MENRVRFEFHIGREAYEHLHDLARRAKYKNLDKLFQHGILLMEMIVSSYEEGFEFFRVKGEKDQERIVFVFGDEQSEEESAEPTSAPMADVVQLFPEGESDARNEDT